MNYTHNPYLRKLALFGLMTVLGIGSAAAQVDSQQIQMFRDEPKGNIEFRKKGMLDGNLVRTVYFNDASISDWFSGAVSGPHGEWPKGTGHRSLDGLALLVGAKFKITNTLGQEQYITPLESAYREEMDKDPGTGEVWGFEPVPGYARANSEIPAIDANKNSYPEKWPRSIFYDLYKTDESQISLWDGYWYGYFGRGVRNAQLETFFVIDDSKDREFTRIPYAYYPIKSDSARGGLGIRVEVRGFQWTHVLAEDIIFWHYDIINLADNKYDSTVFGFYTDPSVGSVDNDARFNSQLDMAYAWAPTGKGLPDNYKTGYYGQAFLESPGNGTNGLDDDEDGMVDERRDDGIDNDGDWTPYTDANGNGKWDVEEPLNDDVGTDGVAQFDLQYDGPDADGTQGNGVPDAGEPNFDKTDKDESDQIGLQSAYIGLLSDKGPNGVWPKNDLVMWNKMTQGFIDTTAKSNISMVFSSGKFPLGKNERERFSIAILFGDDLDDLIFNKKTVQAIYDANYNFAQPPYTPTLTAVAGDRKVFLYWDDVAEKSYDKFLKTFDFEGYLLYRSTEAEFLDIKTVTDSKGQGKFWKPIAQWDLIDTIKGPDPVGINGAHFWRGDDSGLDHSYVDTDVKNGVKYYYALVSYDKGVVPNKIDSVYGPTGGLTPSECTKIITEDFNGILQFVDINCAVVTPTTQAAGYVPPTVEGTLSSVKQGIGTGSMAVSVINPNLIKEGYIYKVIFDSTGGFPGYKTTTYSILRQSSASAAAETLVINKNINTVGSVKPTSPFDGMTATIANDTTVAIIDSLTGWAAGNKTNTAVRARLDVLNPAKTIAWPGDYEIKFFNTPQDTGAFASGSYIKAPVNFTITNITNGYRNKFLIQDMDGSGTFTSGDTIRILEAFVSTANFKFTYRLSYFNLPVNSVQPAEGDKFIIRTSKQFAENDYFEFTTHAAGIKNDLAKGQMDNISVVPNPYIGTASWERRVLLQAGRGDRKIDFTHLPPVCTIRIYTVAGALVKTLYKNSSFDNGSLSWDLISDDGMEVAYGLYIYHVDAPNIGEHIGKFAVIK